VFQGVGFSDGFWFSISAILAIGGKVLFLPDHPITRDLGDHARFGDFLALPLCSFMSFVV